MAKNDNAILIDTIRILGFRGIKNLEISLCRITVLIGINNSGKTSIMKALQLALGDYPRYLSEEDFYIGNDEKRTNEILVDVRIVPQDSAGNRAFEFNEDWAAEFGDKIKAESNGNQFVAIRTRVKPNETKGGFDVLRCTLETWPSLTDWHTSKIKETKISIRILSISFIFIDPQRDIYQELRDKSSFVGRILSGIDYDKKQILLLEELIKNINDEAVNSSNELENFKKHLKELDQSFSESGSVEIAPFPKKIRDLFKNFSIYFGEDENSIFSIEYHGMGTRSWASILAVKAFINSMAIKHEENVEQFFPILAAEEPEAHLHPNAQKTLYKQLAQSRGQVIVSTHSPYFAAIANHLELRCLKKSSNSITVRGLDPRIDGEDLRRLQREIIHSRGEILFSKALVLCEGETEEQALPLLFKKYFESDAFVLGVSFIGVGGSGKKYLPFFTYSRDFQIPVFIFSDGEEEIVKQLKSNYGKIFGAIDITKCENITILENNDFESYLVSSGFKPLIESAIKSVDGNDAIDNWIKKKDGLSSGRIKTNKPPCACCKQFIFEDVIRDYQGTKGYDQVLMDIIDSGKPKYAPAIAAELCTLETKKFPEKIIEFFEKIKKGVLI